MSGTDVASTTVPESPTSWSGAVRGSNPPYRPTPALGHVRYWGTDRLGSAATRCEESVAEDLKRCKLQQEVRPFLHLAVTSLSAPLRHGPVCTSRSRLRLCVTSLDQH
eukprot:1250652-Rhodomonas_salina.1